MTWPTHAVGCYGNRDIRTPNIDDLASDGIRFEKAYANSPMCTPSRASIMTGRYPHSAGVTLLRTALPDSVVTIAEILQQHGIATGVFGKTHFNSQLKHGFDTLVNNQHHRGYLENIQQPVLSDTVKVRPPWRPFQDHSRTWLNADGATSGNQYVHSQGHFFAKSAIDFIKEHQENGFFTVASFREPHSPFNFPVEFQGAYKNFQPKLPTGSKEDQRWIPEEFKDLTSEEREGIIKSYYSSVEYMDQNVGLLLEALRQMNIVENTLVIFVGDHGYLLNHHLRFEKHMMWEEAVTTPLIIRGYQQGKVVKTPVELVDLAPTILQAMNIDRPSIMQGKPLQGLLEGTSDVHRTYSFVEYLTDNKAMITNGTWKYIFTTGKRDLGSGYATGQGPSGVNHRLYNLISDPRETRNLGDLPEHQDLIRDLQTIMIRKFRETHPLQWKVPMGTSLENQLILFCEPPEGESQNEL